MGHTRRSFIKTNSALVLGLSAGHTGLGSMLKGRAPEMSLVENGRSRVPVVLAADAGEAIRVAAGELADYIEKISGGRPEIISGPKSLPESAIWVGIQPQLGKAYSGLDTGFYHPEEILIACNGQHLVIAGRDKFFRNQQIEYGSANAVYTFLQDYLKVRWLWPGDLGEDIIPMEDIGIPSFEYRFHPDLLRRSSLLRNADRLEPTDDWTRYQRLKLDSLKGPAGGHAFTDWWKRFHKEHPEWFALQHDGTRSLYPDQRTVKMCLSNPGVWDQWVEDAVEDIKKNPELNMIMAGENDAHSSGICMCEDCRAWDHPDGQPWTYRYEDGYEWEYVAMTDRNITFWNHVARKLKERFPDRDNLYVQGLAYGPTTPPPVEAVPDDNVIVSYVGKFPTIDEATRQPQKKQFAGWSASAPHIFYRPNLWYWTGGVWALPDVALENDIEDFRFLAENNCIGLFADTAFEHWVTQLPQYYLMAQLTWDPMQNARKVLDDYYERGFGKAARPIEKYWDLMEEGFKAVTSSEGFGPHGSYRYRLLEIFEEVYTPAFFGKAEGLIRKAEQRVMDEPEIYRKRVDFVRTGLVLSRLMVENIPLMTRVRETGGKDREAVRKVQENWEAIEKLYRDAGPVAFNYENLIGKMKGGGYQGNMEDYFGPPAEKFITGTAGIKQEKRDERDDID